MSAPAVKVEKVRKTNVGSDSKAKRIER